MSEPIAQQNLQRPALASALTELENRQLIELAGGHYRATSRWHAALARAAKHFADYEEPLEDIRLPISKALIDIFRDQLTEGDLLAAVEIMLELQHSPGE